MFTNIEYIALGVLVIINLTAFVVMLNDKRRSMHNNTTERIPEGILFFMGAAGGSIGIYTAMFLLRHKTRKWYFLIGIPLLIVQNVTTVYLLLDSIMYY